MEEWIARGHGSHAHIMEAVEIVHCETDVVRAGNESDGNLQGAVGRERKELLTGRRLSDAANDIDFAVLQPLQ